LRVRNQDPENDNVIIVASAKARDTAIRYNLYVCRNRRRFKSADYIAFYSEGVINCVAHIVDITDDVDLVRDHFPQPDVTFARYIRSKSGMNAAAFAKLFGINPGDKLRTVFRLDTVKIIKPVINDSRDKNGNECPFTYGQPRYTTLKRLLSSTYSSQLVYQPKRSIAIKIGGIKATDEQLEIIERFEDGRNMIIQAFAGTGKTTTLQMLTKAYPDRTFLYIVFNHAAAEDARLKFGDNVNVKTLHALAFEHMKERINMKGLTGNYRIASIADMLGIDYNHARAVRTVFDSFCWSDIKFMDREYVNTLFRENFELLGLLKTSQVSLDKVFVYTKELYRKMEEGKIPVTHNFYLKQFQLLGIPETLKFDAILLDEAQDSNLITYDIVNRIQGQKVVIGDRHQKIYGFRNSLDISEKFLEGSVDTFHLTNSFRFHQGIADLANKLLEILKGEKTRIHGIAPDSREIKDYAIITRTNAKIIDEISGMINEKDWKTVRDPKELFKLSLSITKLFTNKKINYDVPPELFFLEKFKNIDKLSEYAKEVKDVELMSAIKAAKYKYRCIERCFTRALEQYEVKDARVFLTTAHTSKGLEWDKVRLTDDYPDILDEIGESFKDLETFLFAQGIGNRSANHTSEEINLMYVAVTRAKALVEIKSIENGEIIFYSGTEEIDKKLSIRYKAKGKTGRSG